MGFGEHDEEGRRLVSNSEIETFRDCPRRWWLTYYRELTPVRNSDPVGCANQGTLIHWGLDLWYSGAVDFDSAKLEAAMLSRMEDEVAEADDDIRRAEDLSKAHRIARAVVLRYVNGIEESGEDAGLTFRYVEQEFRAPLNESVTLRGKVDAVVSRGAPGAEEVLVEDHKSVTGYTDASWAHMRPQFLSYALLMWVAGLPVWGVLLNMLKRAENPRTEPYKRVEVPINETQVRNHRTHLASTVYAMEYAAAALDDGDSHHFAVPPHPSRDCDWKCPFVDVCPMFDRGEDAEYVLSTEFEKYDPNARYGGSDDPAE